MNSLLYTMLHFLSEVLLKLCLATHSEWVYFRITPYGREVTPYSYTLLHYFYFDRILNTVAEVLTL